MRGFNKFACIKRIVLPPFLYQFIFSLSYPSFSLAFSITFVNWRSVRNHLYQRQKIDDTYRQILTFNCTNICAQKDYWYLEKSFLTLLLEKIRIHGIRNSREKKREYYFLEIFLVQNSITKPYSNIPTKKRI